MRILLNKSLSNPERVHEKSLQILQAFCLLLNQEHLSQAPRGLRAYFNDKTQAASFLASASLTCGFAGMGIAPHVPLPPF